MLIFVFARVSCGLSGAILADFGSVPNAPSDVDSPRNPEIAAPQAVPVPPPAANSEHGGPTGPEPTRFGDWERKGRCIDF